MNYTENYHLPQWEKSDRVQMEDFNQMCLDMDTGLVLANQAAQRHGDSAAAAAQLASAAAAQAQSTADAALSKANDAYCAGNKPYVVGTYVGTGGGGTGSTGTPHIINVGFTPSFVIVGGCTTSAGIKNQTGAAGRSGSLNDYLQCVEGGFKVGSSLGDYMPRLNEVGLTYAYIAFR